MGFVSGFPYKSDFWNRGDDMGMAAQIQSKLATIETLVSECEKTLACIRQMSHAANRDLSYLRVAQHGLRNKPSRVCTCEPGEEEQFADPHHVVAAEAACCVRDVTP